MRPLDAFPSDPRLLTSAPDRTPPAVDLTVSVRSFYFSIMTCGSYGNVNAIRLYQYRANRY